MGVSIVPIHHVLQAVKELEEDRLKELAHRRGLSSVEELSMIQLQKQRQLERTGQKPKKKKGCLGIALLWIRIVCVETYREAGFLVWDTDDSFRKYMRELRARIQAAENKRPFLFERGLVCESSHSECLKDGPSLTCVCCIFTCSDA